MYRDVIRDIKIVLPNVDASVYVISTYQILYARH